MPLNVSTMVHLQANYIENIFMARVPHTYYNHRELTLQGEPRQLSSYEKYLNARPKLKVQSVSLMLTTPGAGDAKF